MKEIWKYELILEDYNIVSLPKGAKPLSVQVQGENTDHVRMWCLINLNEEEYEERVFRVVGTGYSIKDENIVYIDTFQLYNGSFVGHVFEVIR
jgi:hypothetical protein